jgi:photosystem II stability/assembly factor-like uncharacterized protein
MKFLAAIFVLVALASCAPSSNVQSPTSNFWLPFQHGLPTQSTVLALAVDPQDSHRLYAGTYDTTGAYITTDQARTWRAFDTGLDHTPILTLAAFPNAILAGTTAGLYRLIDRTWTRLAALPDAAIYSIARDARGAIYLATDRHGIFSSTDAGATWSHIPGMDNEIALSAAALDAQTIFVGTSGHGAFVTRDRGRTWHALHEFSGDYVSLIAIDPRDTRSIYLRTRGALFRSPDAGETWQPLAVGDIVHALLFDAFSNRVYAATGGRGVLVSGDAGATWQSLADGLPLGTATLSLAQVDAKTLLAGTQIGIYITRDAGLTWHAASDGLGAPQVHALELNPRTGALFAATETGLYRADGNGNLARVGGETLNAPVLSIALAPNQPDAMYAGAYRRGIFVSRDGGASWQSAGGIFHARLSPTGLAVDPWNDQNVFARVLFERIYKSTDGGDTWHAVWSGMPDTAEVETMSIAPSDPARMYAGTDKGLYYSQNAGESWTPRGLDTLTVFALWIDPRDPNAVLAGATDGLYRSADAGNAWTRIGLAQISVTAIVRAANGDLFAGTKYNGVWVSRDGAKNWTQLGSGLDHASVISLIVDDARGLLYTATTRGVFKLATR